MQEGVPWHGDVKKRYPELAERVLGEIPERGPLGSKDFTGKADPAPHRAGTSSEAMWSWKPAKQMLDALFASGELVIAGRVNFHRLYDLPERVLPRHVLDFLPLQGGGDQDADPEGREGPRCPERDRHRRACTADLVRQIRQREGRRLRTWTLLVTQGDLERVAVFDDPPAQGRRRAGVELDRPRPNAAVLLSPFDNLLWGYQYATRVLGFAHVIELYKPAPQRQYGYYVLPFLWRDKLVGRADLKSERKDGTLVVKAFHLEPGVRISKALDEAFQTAVDRVRRIAGLERVTRADR